MTLLKQSPFLLSIPLFICLLMVRSDNNAEIKLQFSDDAAQGKYANLAVVAHSSSEFVIDFAKVLPGFQSPLVHTRVIMAPEHLKRLIAALQDNMNKFEQLYGEVKLPEQHFVMPAMTPKGEA